MKKAAKIGVPIGCAVLVVLIITTTVNLWIKRMVCHQLDRNIATVSDSLKISYGDIRVAAFRGRAWIKDAHFCSKTTTWEQTEGPIAEASVEVLSLDGINYFNWLIHRQLNLRGLTVIRPTFRMRFNYDKDHESEGDALREQLVADRMKRLERMLQIARIFIDDATLARLTIDQANVQAEAINDSLKISVPEFTMSLYDLGYNIRDSIPHYNDSVFHFLFRDVDVNISKVPISLKVSQLKAEPSGMVEVEDVWIRSYLNPEKSESVTTNVDRITIGGFNVAKFNTFKQMDVANIHIFHPQVDLLVDESVPAASSDKIRGRDTEEKHAEIDLINQKIWQVNAELATEFITGLTVDTIFIHDASLGVRSTKTVFRLNARQISTALYGVGFSLINEIPYHYNDSVYQFHLGDVDILTPDSTVAISASNMNYDNGGAFSLGKTHVCHVIDRWKLTHLMGDVPVSWVDIHLDSLYTSSINIVKKAYSLEKGFVLDTLYADVRKMTVFRDARNPAKQPYQLPQTYICQLKYPFVVNCVKANLRDIHIEMALTKQNIGQLNLGPANVQISNVTSIRNSTIKTVAKGRMGKANLNMAFTMKVNPSCDWDIVLNARNVDVHHLDGLVYPIVGMKIGCDIHRLHAEYGGNNVRATGTFCMEYDNVDIFADKNSTSPIKVVRDLSGLINSAGKTIVNPSNPFKPGQVPVAYQVKWKNDPHQHPALFYVGPLIDGCVTTMLPGLFLHRRLQTPKPAQPAKP